MDVIVERCAGLDIGKSEVVAAVRLPTPSGGRRQQVRTFGTFTPQLRDLANWLEASGVTKVVMEATGQYWFPVWQTLEDRQSMELLLVNARHVRMLPGRKTDVGDAAWLAELLEHGLLRGSFVPPRQVRELRDLTRYRKRLIQDHTSEAARLEKVLEDAGIKLDVVASDMLGVSGRAMITALVAGETDPGVLAEMAKGRLRRKLPELRHALDGRFGPHHRRLARFHLAHLEHLETTIAELDTAVEELIAPFAEARQRLQTIPGVGQRAAEVIIGEIGTDMGRFPTPGHLASWAGLCPGNNITGGKRRSTKTRQGNTMLRDILTQSAWAAARSRNTYLSARFWRLTKRIGKKKAALAVAHSILCAAWHILNDNVDYQDLGADWFTNRSDTNRRRDHLISQLQQLGYHVALTHTAA